MRPRGWHTNWSRARTIRGNLATIMRPGSQEALLAQSNGIVPHLHLQDYLGKL